MWIHTQRFICADAAVSSAKNDLQDSQREMLTYVTTGEDHISCGNHVCCHTVSTAQSFVI